VFKFMKNITKRKANQSSENQSMNFKSKRGKKNKGSDERNQSMNPNIATTKYKVASCQSPGQERAHNEDTLFTLNSFLGGLDVAISFGIYLVADGMGGHQSGELASNLAAQGVSQYLMERVHDNFLFERKSFSQSDIKQWLLEAVEAAQKLILRRVPGGGTTLTLVMVLDDEIFSAHVGDSRLYVIGLDGKLTLKTRDHSLVKRLVDLGEITEGEAGNHPHRNVLYRAMGQSDPFEPDIEVFSLQPGERIMICSDGLWGVIDEEKIMQIVKNGPRLNQIVCELVHAANAAGGPDNISVIIVERLE